MYNINYEINEPIYFDLDFSLQVICPWFFWLLKRPMQLQKQRVADDKDGLMFE
jgi:hypothetical protein